MARRAGFPGWAMVVEEGSLDGCQRLLCQGFHPLPCNARHSKESSWKASGVKPEPQGSALEFSHTGKGFFRKGQLPGTIAWSKANSEGVTLGMLQKLGKQNQQRIHTPMGLLAGCAQLLLRGVRCNCWRTIAP